MTQDLFTQRLRTICADSPPSPPGHGATPERHRRLLQVALEDVSLAKLVEAHWDALAILAEAGKAPASDAVYGVWASEIPGQELTVEARDGVLRVSGTKRFCSGAGLVDRVLLTAAQPGPQMVEVDLLDQAATVKFDDSSWTAEAFRLTRTSEVRLDSTEAVLVGEGTNWYVERPGFWNGACGPAACWAGGAAGLLRYAERSRRVDPHTVAHLGAMQANVWAMEHLLDAAGKEIDEAPLDREQAAVRALTLRHLIDQLASDVLERFLRAYGPHPLALDAETSRRFAETQLYLRQCHAERDLQSLGEAWRARP